MSIRALILSATALSTFLAPGIALAQTTGSSPARADSISELTPTGFSLRWLPGVVRDPNWLMTSSATANNSNAIGVDATASGQGSTAIGSQAIASGS